MPPIISAWGTGREELPSPDSTLAVPTSAMPTCSGGSTWSGGNVVRFTIHCGVVASSGIPTPNAATEVLVRWTRGPVVT